MTRRKQTPNGPGYMTSCDKETVYVKHHKAPGAPNRYSHDEVSDYGPPELFKTGFCKTLGIGAEEATGILGADAVAEPMCERAVEWWYDRKFRNSTGYDED